MTEKTSNKNNTSFTYTIPDRDSSLLSESYRIVIYSEEDTSISSTVYITPVEKPRPSVSLNISGISEGVKTVTDSAEFTAGGGALITVTPSVTNTWEEYGYNYKIEHVTEKGTSTVTEKKANKNNVSFTYTLPAYDLSVSSDAYRITVYSEEDTSVKSIALIKLVKPDPSVSLSIKGCIGGNKSASKSIDVTASGGAVITVTPSVTNTFTKYGYNYKVERITASGNTTLAEKKSNKNNTSFSYKFPDYDWENGNNEYRITVYSEENNSFGTLVNVTVMPKGEVYYKWSRITSDAQLKSKLLEISKKTESELNTNYNNGEDYSARILIVDKANDAYLSSNLYTDYIGYDRRYYAREYVDEAAGIRARYFSKGTKLSASVLDSDKFYTNTGLDTPFIKITKSEEAYNPDNKNVYSLYKCGENNDNLYKYAYGNFYCNIYPGYYGDYALFFTDEDCGEGYFDPYMIFSFYDGKGRIAFKFDVSKHSDYSSVKPYLGWTEASCYLAYFKDVDGCGYISCGTGGYSDFDIFIGEKCIR